MRLLINTASTFKGGGVQVAVSFIEECKKLHQHHYFVVLGAAVAKAINTSDFPENFEFLKAPFRPATRYFSLKSHNNFLKKSESKFKPDVVFTTSGPSYWKPKSPHLMGYNIPHYIYPESPYFNRLSLRGKSWWFAMKIFAYFNFKFYANAYVVQTDDVNRRLKKFIRKTNVHTVSNTVNAHYLNPRVYSPKLDRPKAKEFRVLTVSAWYPHKNLEIIPKVIEELRTLNEHSIKFVLTIRQEDLEEHHLATYQEVVNVGPVKIEEVPSLYNETDTMFLPTLLECFSASYVEAMQMQKPIITSNMGFAHTVCGDAAKYIDPVNAKEIAKAIVELKNSIILQEDLIAKGSARIKEFGSAQNRAEKYLQICEDLI